jgi:hypothetical protein
MIAHIPKEVIAVFERPARHLSARALQWQAGDVLGGLSTLGEMSRHNSTSFFGAKHLPIPGCTEVSELKQ